MTAPQYDQGGIVPKVMPAAGWPGRPNIDVPGLEQPAHFVHAALTLDDIGHRAILVIASESGDAVTTDQLTALADALDEMYWEEAPNGSRAHLRDQLAKHRDEIDRMHRADTNWRNRAELAEALLRDRSQMSDAAVELERQGLDLVRTREALRAQQHRAAGLYAEREEATGRVEELTAMLEQARHELTTHRERENEHVNELMAAIRDDGPYPRGPIADHLHNLRGRAEVAERALDKLRSDRVQVVEALMAEKDAHETTRAAHDQVADRLRLSRSAVGAEAERAQEAETKYRHERDARRALLAVWKLDIRAQALRRKAATQRARSRTTKAALAGSLAGAAAALLARRAR